LLNLQKPEEQRCSEESSEPEELNMTNFTLPLTKTNRLASSKALCCQFNGELYGQCWMVKTTFPAIWCRFVPTVYPCARYREFGEFMMTAAVYNLKQLSNGDPHAVIEFNKSDNTFLFPLGNCVECVW